MRVCGSNLSSERKTSVLQHCLRVEGQEILETLPAITTSDGAEGDNSLNEFESTLLRLDKHFLPKVSIILQRFYFGKRKQNDDESIEDFVTPLHKLASSCNFGENLEECIRDQFMLECKCDKVREALWAKNDPTLDEVLIIAKQVEHSMACIENLRKSKDASMDSQILDTKTKYRSQTSNRTRLSCFRCGSTTHLANSKDCPAIHAMCNNCSKKGHFAKYCRSLAKSRVKIQEVECEEDREFVLQIINDVNCVADKRYQYPSDNVEVNGTSISMMMDSGAKLPLVSVSDFVKHFKGNVLLLDPDIIPYSYGGKPIELKGYFEATITSEGTQLLGKYMFQ
ncbi:hypothetical protein NDU88_000928 [Pleurodeles waltl]|uniref:CCHC-type domain-containing protein n=1 Tax=Pleurodeles waltl TaxID=8319 RepID=A0AAV7R882_PLEWA|nr:hypothetical protein NDU88_000928 [Pleurodeles waltl]